MMTSALPAAALALCLAASSGCGNTHVVRAKALPEKAVEAPTETTTDTSEQNRSVTLEWAAPTRRADGSALAPSEISGYHVRVWKEPGKDGRIVEVGQDAKATISDLEPGRYFFAVRCIDADGAPGDWSERISFTVR